MKMLSKKSWLSWIKMRYRNRTCTRFSYIMRYCFSIHFCFFIWLFHCLAFLSFRIWGLRWCILSMMHSPYRAFLSSCLTSRLSSCRNQWHSDFNWVLHIASPYMTCTPWTGTSQSHPFLPISLASNSHPKYQPHAKPTLVSNKYPFMMFYLAFIRHKIICNFVIFFYFSTLKLVFFALL